MLYAIISILFVGMNNNFRITICTEMMPAFLEFFLQLSIVIDLTIVDNQDALIFVEDRLLTTSYINNRQATHTQCNSILDPDSMIVWPTMANYLAHMIYHLLRASVTALHIDKTSYSAHD